MMLMLCWRKACQSLKRCVRQRTNMAGTVIINQMLKKVFSPWWPKLRLSWRVSIGSVSSGWGLIKECAIECGLNTLGHNTICFKEYQLHTCYLSIFWSKLIQKTASYCVLCVSHASLIKITIQGFSWANWFAEVTRSAQLKGSALKWYHNQSEAHTVGPLMYVLVHWRDVKHNLQGLLQDLTNHLWNPNCGRVTFWVWKVRPVSINVTNSCFSHLFKALG